MTTSSLDYLPRLPRFDYLEPETISESCALLAKYGGKAKVLAGGTDLLVSMKRKKQSPTYLINLKSIPGLDYIRYSAKGGLRLGALARLWSIASSPIINDKFRLLATAANKIGTPQVRNMGTIGGNVCNAGPSQDSIPALLVLDARLKLVSQQAKRIVPVDQFFIGPFQTALSDSEILTEIEIPAPRPRSEGCYHWLTKKTEVDETLVGVAVLITPDSTGNICEDIKIGLCSVAPTPIRAKRAEVVMRGRAIESSAIEEAAQVAAEETTPRSRADYRRQMTAVLVKRAVNEVLQKIRQTVD